MLCTQSTIFVLAVLITVQNSFTTMLSSCSGDPSKGKEGEVPAVGSVAGGGRLVHST